MTTWQLARCTTAQPYMEVGGGEGAPQNIAYIIPLEFHNYYRLDKISTGMS